MDYHFLIKGIIVGLIVAVPVGPIGVLCLCRTLDEGRLHGIVSGFGGATADALYAFVAVYGISAISGLIMDHELIFQLMAAMTFALLGLKVYMTKPAAAVCATERNSLWQDYISTFFLTLTNPVTILTFVAMFAAFGAASAKSSYIYEGELVIGVFIGSALWWLILGGGFHIFKFQLDRFKMKKVYQVSGMIIVGLGLLMLLPIW